MNTKDKCIKFACEGLTRLERDGETLPTVEWLTVEADRITARMSGRRLGTCEYAGGVLDIHTITQCFLYTLVKNPKASGFLMPEQTLREGWDEVRVILRELAGLDPIKTHERERAKWTQHWQHLYACDDEEMRAEVIKTAKRMYPDFDLTLLGPT